MARPEPFRALLEMAAAPAGARPADASPAPTISPALALDDEHKRQTLEQRLDAVVLAAGATPPHGLRAPRRPLVPLRLDAPDRCVPGELAPPPPRVLAFLQDEPTRPDGPGIADSVSLPRLEPLTDTGHADGPGVPTNVYRLASAEAEETPARPLPAVAAPVEVDADLDNRETRALRRASKVMTLKSLDRDISLRAFSSHDTDPDGDDLSLDGFDDNDLIERESRSPAAVALPAVSDEGVGELGTIDDVARFGGDAALDELAAAWGLVGGLVVLRGDGRPPGATDEGDPTDDLEEITADDIEFVAVASPADPLDAVLVPRAPALVDDGDDVVDYDDDLTPPRGTPSLPPSLLRGAADALAFDDRPLADLFDDDATPPRGTPRPALQAPGAVRFVVEDAPARPRHDALTAEEAARNRLRARELYLIALDDIADGDPHGAVVHLELAIAYDDQTPLYQDLLAQLCRKQKKSADREERCR